MPSFRSPQAQAQHAASQLAAHGQARHSDKQEGMAHSIRTEHAYRQQLSQAAQWMQEQGHMQGLNHITTEQAQAYLIERSELVCQKTLDLDRQALQAHLGEKLERTRSEVPTTGHGNHSRAYTPAQVQAITQAQQPHNALSTEIANAAGLRAHELLTIQRVDERPASDHREWREDRFAGRDGVTYTVTGKGGLTREVQLPQELADRLEDRRLDEPRTVTDREIHYQQHYDIAGGKTWAQSFSRASDRELGWSNGAHGLRHSYTQDRVEELQRNGYNYDDAKAVVSQELGHFRPDVVEAYLR